jgi:3-deoxy-manno-octulosonate cytidylyltransferase (CMP-KDO synthetase)
LGHIGLYALRMHALRRFVALPAGALEQAEKLEQLRLLENGIPIQVVLTGLQSHGVDRPEDIPRLERLMRAGSGQTP